MALPPEQLRPLNPCSPMDEIPWVLTIEQAAQLLGLERETVTAWARAGVIPAYHAEGGRAIRIPAARLLGWQFEAKMSLPSPTPTEQERP